MARANFNGNFSIFISTYLHTIYHIAIALGCIPKERRLSPFRI